MALLGYEGFDNLNNPVNDLPVKPFGPGVGVGAWVNSGGSGATSPGLLSGLGLRPAGATGFYSLTLATNYATLVAGFRYKTHSTAATLSDIFQFKDAATVQCGISVNAAAKLIFWRGTNATVLATGATTLVNSSWYMIEIKTTINSATGTLDIKINGVAETGMTGLTGLNTRSSANNFANSVAIVLTTSLVSVHDDFYLCDTSGSAPYNDFLGIIRIETIYPTANNSVTWTPNASTNASQVQEAIIDGDVTFNATATAGLVDTFTHASLSSTPVSVYGVAVCVYIRKDDVSVQSARTKLISGATTSNGATVAINTAYQFMRDIYTADPNTAGAWTGANVNASKIGYEHT